MPGKSHKNVVAVGGQNFTVYSSGTLTASLAQLTEKLTIYQAVKWGQILKAVYEQGRKEGAMSVFTAINDKVIEVQNEIPHRNPGQPKKKKRK